MVDIPLEGQITIYIAIMTAIGFVFIRQSKTNERIAAVEQAIKSISDMSEDIGKIREDLERMDNRMDNFFKSEIETLKDIAKSIKK